MEHLSARSQRKVDDIVEQASRLFVRMGYQKVTMESVAQYANVSKVTLYKYFNDKLTLYEYILLHNLETDEEKVKEIVTDLIPYPEKVNQLVHFIVSGYLNPERPRWDEDVLLSLDATKKMKKAQKKLRMLRYKLYNQGRMEEFINEAITDETLDLYFNVVVEGLVQNGDSIHSLEEDQHQLLLETLLYGIKKSHE